MEELVAVEHICREDPKVIEQCELSGIPKEEMHKVYCDPWVSFSIRCPARRLYQLLTEPADHWIR